MAPPCPNDELAAIMQCERHTRAKAHAAHSLAVSVGQVGLYSFVVGHGESVCDVHCACSVGSACRESIICNASISLNHAKMQHRYIACVCNVQPAHMDALIIRVFFLFATCNGEQCAIVEMEVDRDWNLVSCAAYRRWVKIYIPIAFSWIHFLFSMMDHWCS